MFSSHEEEPGLCQFPVLEAGFSPQEIQELMDNLLEPGDEVMAASPYSGSDQWSNQGSGSADSNSMDEERKRKRKLSNRESARRSRWRKKRHLEDLTTQTDRLTNENRELKNRLGLVVNRCHLVRRQNEKLRSESVALWARLSDLHRIFEVMQQLAVAPHQVSLMRD